MSDAADMGAFRQVRRGCGLIGPLVLLESMPTQVAQGVM
jgi:hypothetical protein